MMIYVLSKHGHITLRGSQVALLLIYFFVIPSNFGTDAKRYFL